MYIELVKQKFSIKSYVQLQDEHLIENFCFTNLYINIILPYIYTNFKTSYFRVNVVVTFNRVNCSWKSGSL